MDIIRVLLWLFCAGMLAAAIYYGLWGSVVVGCVTFLAGYATHRPAAT